MDVETLKKIQEAVLAHGPHGVPPQLRGGDAQYWFSKPDHWQLQLTRDILYRKGGHKFNLAPKSNTNYLASALASASRGRTIHEGALACSSCRKNNGPFSLCITMRFDDHDLLKGACTNCASGNNFARCDHSGHVAVPRRQTESSEVSSSPRRPGSSASGSGMTGTSQRYVKMAIPEGIDQNTPEGAMRIAALLAQRQAEAMNRAAQGRGMGSQRLNTASSPSGGGQTGSPAGPGSGSGSRGAADPSPRGGGPGPRGGRSGSGGGGASPSGGSGPRGGKGKGRQK